MHCAWWSRLSLALSDIPPCGPPPGWSLLRHVCAAFWNAGDCAIPSGTLGPSGKFGTACERMQFANASRLGRFEAVVPVGLVEDPQAAIAIVQVAAANAIGSNAVRPGRSWFNFQSCRIDRPALRGVPVFSPGEGTAAL